MRGVILLATGHRKQGLDVISEWIKETEEQKKRRKGINSKKTMMLKQLTELRDAVVADTDFTRFPQQFKFAHGHSS